MATITNTVRWADNTAELRKNLLDGVDTINVMKQAVDRTVQSMSGTGLFGAANKVAAAIQEVGGVTKLTAAEQARANAVIEKAIEKYEAMGLKAPQALRDLAAATKQTETATVSLEARLSAMSSAARTVGVGLSAALTAPLVGLGAVALKSSMDFETAFAGVRKTVSGTPKELDAINASFREMAKTTPATVVELSKIGEMAGQLGVQKEKIVGFTKTIVDISTATNLTADEAGSAFARLANVMKMPQEQFSNLGSAVVALGNFGASTEQEMLSMGQRIAAAGATAGMSVPQVLGIANALSSVGIEAEAGGTAVSRVINKISMDVANGGGKLETFAKIAGKSAKDFAESWRADAGVAFSDFMQGLAQARERGGDELLGLMHELGFDANVRLVNAFMSAANAGDLMRDSIALGSKAFKENTEITRASEERYKTTANQVKVLWNNLNDVALTIGDALVPMFNDAVVAIKPLIGHVAELAKGFKDLPDLAKYAVVGVAGLAAAAGPLILALGGVAFSVTQVMHVLAAFPAIGLTATAVLQALTTGAMGAATFAAGIVAAAAAVGTLSYALTRLADVASGGKLSGWLTSLVAHSANIKLAAQETAAGQDAIALAFQRTGVQAKTAAEALALNTAWLTRHNAQIADGAKAATAFIGPLQQTAQATNTLADRIKALTEEQRKDIASKVEQGYGIKNIAKETGIAQEVVSAYIKQQHLATAGDKARAEALKEYASVAEDARSTVLGMNAATVEGIRYDLQRGISQKTLEQVYGATAQQIKAVVAVEKEEKQELDDTIKRMEQFHKVGEEGAAAVARGMAGLKFVLRDLGAAMGDIQLATSKSFVGMSTLMPDLSRQAREHMATFRTSIKDPLMDVLRGVPQMFVSAFTGGGGLMGAVQGLGSQLGSVLGNSIGKTVSTLGSLGGPIGAAIGSLAGPLIGAIGKLFSNPEKQINPIREAFVQAAGGLAQLNARAAEAGVTLRALLDARNPEQYKKAIEELNAAFQFQDNALKTLDDTAAKWGFTLAEAPAKFRQGKLDEQLLELYRDQQILTAGGFEFDAILQKQAKSFQELIAVALETGATIPIQLQPAIQRLIDMGLLTDAAGEKLTDVSQLTFAETLDQKFNTLIDDIHKLIEAISRGLGTALTNIPQVPAPWAGWGNPPMVPDLPGDNYAWRGGLVTASGIVQHFGRGGSVSSLMPSGTDTVPAMLTPGELVLNAGQQRNVAEGLVAGARGGSVGDAAFREIQSELAGLRAEQNRLNRYFMLEFRRDNARAIHAAFQDGRRRG